MLRTTRRVRRSWSGLLGKGHLALFLALLPSVLYIDHWSEFMHPETEISEAERELHESHCHFGSGACGEQPVPTNLNMLTSVVQLPQPTLQSTAVEDSALLVEEAIVITPKEPPRV